MAVRDVDLGRPHGAVIYRFPVPGTTRVAARRAIVRRRIYLALAVAIVVAGVVLGGGPGATSSGSSSRPARVITVRPGDTLWDIAERNASEAEDLRAYVDRIEALNHLSGPLPAGARIRLPN